MEMHILTSRVSSTKLGNVDATRTRKCRTMREPPPHLSIEGQVSHVQAIGGRKLALCLVLGVAVKTMNPRLHVIGSK